MFRIEKSTLRNSTFLGENPQYKLQVNVTGAQNPVVWILLSRHILDRVSLVIK